MAIYFGNLNPGVKVKFNYKKVIIKMALKAESKQREM